MNLSVNKNQNALSAPAINQNALSAPAINQNAFNQNVLSTPAINQNVLSTPAINQNVLNTLGLNFSQTNNSLDSYKNVMFTLNYIKKNNNSLQLMNNINDILNNNPTINLIDKLSIIIKKYNSKSITPINSKEEYYNLVKELNELYSNTNKNNSFLLEVMNQILPLVNQSNSSSSNNISEYDNLIYGLNNINNTNNSLILMNKINDILNNNPTIHIINNLSNIINTYDSKIITLDNSKNEYNNLVAELNSLYSSTRKNDPFLLEVKNQIKSLINNNTLLNQQNVYSQPFTSSNQSIVLTKPNISNASTISSYNNLLNDLNNINTKINNQASKSFFMTKFQQLVNVYNKQPVTNDNINMLYNNLINDLNKLYESSDKNDTVLILMVNVVNQYVKFPLNNYVSTNQSTYSSNPITSITKYITNLLTPKNMSSSTPYSSSSAPYSSSSKLYIASSAPYSSSSAPYSSSSKLYIASSAPYSSSSKPYMASSKPYMASSKPYMASSKPLFIFESNIPIMQNYFNIYIKPLKLNIPFKYDARNYSLAYSIINGTSSVNNIVTLNTYYYYSINNVCIELQNLINEKLINKYPNAKKQPTITITYFNNVVTFNLSGLTSYNIPFQIAFINQNTSNLPDILGFVNQYNQPNKIITSSSPIKNNFFSPYVELDIPLEIDNAKVSNGLIMLYDKLNDYVKHVLPDDISFNLYIDSNYKLTIICSNIDDIIIQPQPISNNLGFVGSEKLIKNNSTSSYDITATNILQYQLNTDDRNTIANFKLISNNYPYESQNDTTIPVFSSANLTNLDLVNNSAKTVNNFNIYVLPSKSNNINYFSSTPNSMIFPPIYISYKNGSNYNLIPTNNYIPSFLLNNKYLFTIAGFCNAIQNNVQTFFNTYNINAIFYVYYDNTKNQITFTINGYYINYPLFFMIRLTDTKDNNILNILGFSNFSGGQQYNTITTSSSPQMDYFYKPYILLENQLQIPYSDSNSLVADLTTQLNNNMKQSNPLEEIKFNVYIGPNGHIYIKCTTYNILDIIIDNQPINNELGFSGSETMLNYFYIMGSNNPIVSYWTITPTTIMPTTLPIPTSITPIPTTPRPTITTPIPTTIATTTPRPTISRDELIAQDNANYLLSIIKSNQTIVENGYQLMKTQAPNLIGIKNTLSDFQTTAQNASANASIALSSAIQGKQTLLSTYLDNAQSAYQQALTAQTSAQNTISNIPPDLQTTINNTYTAKQAIISDYNKIGNLIQDSVIAPIYNTAGTITNTVNTYDLPKYSQSINTSINAINNAKSAIDAAFSTASNAVNQISNMINGIAKAASQAALQAAIQASLNGPRVSGINATAPSGAVSTGGLNYIYSVSNGTPYSYMPAKIISYINYDKNGFESIKCNIYRTTISNILDEYTNGLLLANNKISLKLTIVYDKSTNAYYIAIISNISIKLKTPLSGLVSSLFKFDGSKETYISNPNNNYTDTLDNNNNITSGLLKAYYPYNNNAMLSFKDPTATTLTLLINKQVYNIQLYYTKYKSIDEIVKELNSVFYNLKLDVAIIFEGKIILKISQNDVLNPGISSKPYPNCIIATRLSFNLGFNDNNEYISGIAPNSLDLSSYLY